MKPIWSPAGDNPLLRSIVRRQLEAHQARVLTRVMVETGATTDDLPSKASAAGDPKKLRGLPVVGAKGGMGGAIAGTRPGDCRGHGKGGCVLCR